MFLLNYIDVLPSMKGALPWVVEKLIEVIR
jgi:hypothetical protein